MKHILVFLLLILSVHSAHAGDVPGSKDHPVISRYPGSVISYYEEQKFKTYQIATGPQTGYKKIDKWTEAEGKSTRIYYVVKGQTTLTEVYRNYLSALKRNNASILASGLDDKRNVGKEVGGRTFLGTAYAPNPFPTGKNINLFSGSATSGGSCYIAAKVQKGKTVYHIVIGGTQYKADEKVFMVDIIENTALEDDLITMNVKEMLSGIRATGKIALYGIYFDTDKAEVKPASEPTLSEVAKLLKENSRLNVLIVGHTDMTGSYQHNVDLSERRAQAVVAELVNKYGIASSRLSGAGAGPLCPVATNQDEEGRKQNRRVEIVARN